MFKRKKKAQETYNIPSVEEVDEIILKGKNLDLSIKENLLKKVRELSEYLKNRYAPYLEKFEQENIYVSFKDKSDWYSIYKDKVCLKTHNIIIVYDCHQLKFIERIDEIIDVADKKIIDWFNETKKDNKEKEDKINFITSIKKEK